MGKVAIVGLERDAAGVLDSRAVARLKAADTVVRRSYVHWVSSR